MDAYKKIKETPAEQLLRMIEGPRRSQASAAAKAAIVSPDPLQQWRDVVRGWAVRVMKYITPDVRREADPFLWNLRLVQRLLWVGLGLLGAYMMVDLVLIQPQVRLVSAVSRQAAASAAGQPSAAAPAAMKPLVEYLAVFNEHNPFTGGIASLQAPVVRQSTRRRLEELAKTLTVVGIDRGPNPMALVEQTDRQRTVTVKVGDEINGLRVKHISPEGVLVSYEGEEMVLP